MSRQYFIDLDALIEVDETILDDLSLPTQLNATTVKETLRLETLELAIIYPDPDMLKKAIKIWSEARLFSWQKIADALYKNYDPFINFTRDERREHTETRNLDKLETRNLAGRETRDLDANERTATAAYNQNTAGDYTPRERVDSENNGTIDNTNTGTVDNKDTGTINHVETFHSQGDSALYTPTDIARKEFELRAECDIINMIVREFKEKFVVCVY